MGPGDAAKLLNIDRSTITRWTAHEFKRYMTSGAQGGTGKQRVVTERDLRVLHLIKMLKDTNTPPEEIHATLQQMERVDWEGLPDMPAAPRNMANVPVVRLRLLMRRFLLSVNLYFARSHFYRIVLNNLSSP